MSPSACYIQNCPVCGRPLQIRVVYLGRQLTCQHCRGRFVAADPAQPSGRTADSGVGLPERAQELLRRSALRLDLLRGLITP